MEPTADTAFGGTMAALPQQADVDGDEQLAARPAPSVFRTRPDARPPGYYRNRPLIRLRCSRPPELPARPSDPPRIHLVAPLPPLPETEEWPDEFDSQDAAARYDVADRHDLADRFDPAEDDYDSELEDELDFDAEDETDADYEDDYEDEDDLDLSGDDPVEDESAADLEAEPAEDELTYADDEPADDEPAGVAYLPIADPAGRTASRAIGPREPADDRRAGRDRLPLLLTGIVVAVLAVLGVAGLIVVHRQSGPGQTRALVGVTPVSSDTAGQATTWALANLPGSTKLLADANTQTVLIGRGYPSNNISSISPTTTQTDARYVIVTPDVRQAGVQPGSPIAQMLADALPVAVFGNGQDRVEISQLGAMSTSLSTAQQARLMAGQALDRNPGLTVNPALSTAISEGRLDLRAATVLAVLAGQAQVGVLALPQGAPEQRVGAPARTVRFTVAGTDAAALVDRTLRALPADLAPITSDRQPDGSFQLVWLPDLALSPPVN